MAFQDRAWNNNPFGDDEDEILEVGTVRSERTTDEKDNNYDYYNEADISSHNHRKLRQKKSKKKKKKRISDEESSQADSLLSEILSEDEMDGAREIDRMGTLKEADDEVVEGDFDDDDYDNDSMQVVASTTRDREENAVSTRFGVSARYGVSARLSGRRSDNSQAATDESSMCVQGYQRDDDSSIEDGLNPFDGMKALLKKDKSSNPFSDEENDDEDDEVASDADGDFTNNVCDEEDNEVLQEAKHCDESEDDDEDIVESSKRLLRMADQRIQYQQHSDEVHDLKATILEMESKAEAMAEQLRRAMDTKCDLVLAQNEMERCHEQNLIAKDDEIKDMRKYVQELLDAQARSELNFMNEISSLARTLELVNAKHEKEIKEKDAQIAELEYKMHSMKTGSIRPHSCHEAFTNPFADVENRSVESNASIKKRVLNII